MILNMFNMECFANVTDIIHLWTLWILLYYLCYSIVSTICITVWHSICLCFLITAHAKYNNISYLVRNFLGLFYLELLYIFLFISANIKYLLNMWNAYTQKYMVFLRFYVLLYKLMLINISLIISQIIPINLAYITLIAAIRLYFYSYRYHIFFINGSNLKSDIFVNEILYFAKSFSGEILTMLPIFKLYVLFHFLKHFHNQCRLELTFTKFYMYDRG